MSFAPLVRLVTARRACVALVPLIAGCSSFQVPDSLDVVSKLNPYRIDIRQGNLVTQEMVGQLKAGMSREQVRFLLGTPMLADVFHPDRWDYVYFFKPGNKPEDTQQRRLIVYFEDDRLVSVGGDVVAAEEGEIQPPEQRTRTLDLSEVAAPDKKK
ncbi:Putative outer membrane lipoprotein OmlA [Methyloversatilis universalis FAM5]|jgi:outer membrane protein assembly factor BamE|uniref:Outer membrane protein assembly factor BamE n=1 Tax=Methyloversatilis universalis (strain ATCC BAA-1314 / DSM 25237 / JCM 13912 / CCUG 52030 / FAM5) TaxID=1000565 RepID=F5R821_METUF|nr:outer membrane protein assembly factor BamE [Methyloversatilis universalis]EGK73199.1 Putative outer membrane lipoprotein OmlA [Methyloversatilis universalis FAM5]